jgi:hypothetical protein
VAVRVAVAVHDVSLYPKQLDGSSCSRASSLVLVASVAMLGMCFICGRGWRCSQCARVLCSGSPLDFLFRCDPLPVQWVCFDDLVTYSIHRTNKMDFKHSNLSEKRHVVAALRCIVAFDSF